MKRSITSLLLVFMVSALSANMIYFFGEPIPGVDIIVRKHPPVNIAVAPPKTDKEGKFSIELGASLTKEGSRYDLQLSYEAIMKVLSHIDPEFVKNKENYVIILEITSASKDVTFNGRTAPVKMAIAANTGTLSIFDRWGDGHITGTLTYELRASKPK